MLCSPIQTANDKKAVNHLNISQTHAEWTDWDAEGTNNKCNEDERHRYIPTYMPRKSFSAIPSTTAKSPGCSHPISVCIRVTTLVVKQLLSAPFFFCSSYSTYCEDDSKRTIEINNRCMVSTSNTTWKWIKVKLSRHLGQQHGFLHQYLPALTQIALPDGHRQL